MNWSSTKFRVLLLALVLFGADRASKIAVERSLGLGRSKPVVGDTIRLTHVQNRGVVFGWWSGGNRWVITAVSALVLGVLIHNFWTAPASRRLLLFGLGLVFAGAVGNMWDRVLQGYVTDFVDIDIVFMRWPAFNVADACICFGVVLLAIDLLRGEGRQIQASDG